MSCGARPGRTEVLNWLPTQVVVATPSDYPDVHYAYGISTGKYRLKQRRLTEDGLETTFAVNHLTPFLLTNLLLDLMRSSAPSRVVTVSSTTHQSIQQVNFGNLQGAKHYDGYNAYALSKLGNILFTYELARRLEGTGINANTLHPGTVNTKLLRAGFGSGGAGSGTGYRDAGLSRQLTGCRGCDRQVFRAQAPDPVILLDL